MPQTPSQRWTAAEVLTLVREQIGDVSGKKITDPLVQYYICLALSDIVGAMHMSLDPSYFVSTPITLSDIPSGFKHSYLAIPPILGDGDISAFRMPEAITNPSTYDGVYDPPGYMLPEIGWLAYFVVDFYNNITLTTEIRGLFYAKITNVDVTLAPAGGTPGTYRATYSRIGGNIELGHYPDDWNSIRVVYDKRSQLLSSYDLSAIAYDRIITIIDSNVGTCKQLSPPDFSAADDESFPHFSYADDIVWTQIGNTLYFKHGSRVTAGLKTMYYQRQPTYPSLWSSDAIDIPDKYIGLLVKRAVTYCAIDMNGGINESWAKQMELDLASVRQAGESEMLNKIKNTNQSS